MFRQVLNFLVLSTFAGSCRAPSSNEDSTYTVTLEIQNVSDENLDVDFGNGFAKDELKFSVTGGKTETRSLNLKQNMQSADCASSSGHVNISGVSGNIIGRAEYLVKELGCAPDMTANAVCSSDRCSFELGNYWKISSVPTARQMSGQK